MPYARGPSSYPSQFLFVCLPGAVLDGLIFRRRHAGSELPTAKNKNRTSHQPAERGQPAPGVNEQQRAITSIFDFTLAFAVSQLAPRSRTQYTRDQSALGMALFRGPRKPRNTETNSMPRKQHRNPRKPRNANNSPQTPPNGRNQQANSPLAWGARGFGQGGALGGPGEVKSVSRGASTSKTCAFDLCIASEGSLRRSEGALPKERRSEGALPKDGA
jgi:hypothetical protein